MLSVPQMQRLSVAVPTKSPGLGSGPLKQVEVYRIREFYGLNSVNTGKRRKWYQLLLASLLHPFNILLCLLAITSGIAGELETMTIMLVMVFLSTVLRFHQELKSEGAMESLLKFVATQVTVIRNDMVLGEDMEYAVPSQELVPGDWVKLSPGDLIPADVELINSKDFHVSQAALTGEALPVAKYCRGREASWVSPTDAILLGSKLYPSKELKRPFSLSRMLRRLKHRVLGILGIRTSWAEDPRNTDPEMKDPLDGVNFSDMDRPDVCFMGSAVVSGKATCRVVNTGPRTVFGKLAKELGKQRPPNNFQLGVRRISWLFFLLMILMVPPVLLLQGFLHLDWYKAFMFALSVAVGLTPEMLPMIVNTTLAKGAVEMSSKKCIVKHLDAIINMGAVDVLCTDKTGTLTHGVVTLYKYVGVNAADNQLPLLLGYLNAYFQTCHESPLDVAITDFYGEKLDNGDTEKWQLLEEIPFDFVRRRLSVILQNKEGASSVLICKGAVEEVLSVCTSVILSDDKPSDDKMLMMDNNEKEEMTEEKKAALLKIFDQMSSEGLRVIGVAFKPVSKIKFGCEDEAELTFAGFLAFLDPPKESTRTAIQNLLEHHVSVKVLTGDSPLVCKKICTEIGLPAEEVVTGQQIAEMLMNHSSKPEMLKKIAENHGIFAKLTPIQKAEIVEALKSSGHTVAFLGDGINDAPALSDADVGISVDTGMDICKESADIILLEKDLTVIVDAVVTGRRTYGNTLKYIVMGISSNFGNVFSILIASAWLPFEPMASLHILIQNLLYDTSQIAIPWDRMDPEFLLVSHTWSMKKVIRFMVMIGPWSSVFDIATFLFLWFYMGIQSKLDTHQVKIFQSSWFCVGLLTQTLIVHLIRTPKIPLVQSMASKPVVFMTVVIMAVGLALPNIPWISHALGMAELPWELYPFMAAVLITYAAVTQLTKMLYIKLFKEWY